jgi:hypothetical protein
MQLEYLICLDMITSTISVKYKTLGIARVAVTLALASFFADAARRPTFPAQVQDARKQDAKKKQDPWAVPYYEPYHTVLLAQYELSYQAVL